MELNAEKCKVIHLGQKNRRHQYHIVNVGEQHTLATTNVERDLSVLLSSDLRWMPQCEEAATKANMMLELFPNE